MEPLELDRPSLSLASWSRTARPIPIDPPSWGVRLDDLLFGSSVAVVLVVLVAALVAVLFG